MTQTVTITEHDHITFQLYDASINELKISNRRKSWFYLILLGVLMMLVGKIAESNFLIYYGVFFSVLAIAFGNIYLRWRHKRHYTSHTKNYRKGVGDEIVHLEIAGDVIKMNNRTGDSNLKISEFQVVEEIGSHYFMKISTGYTLIVPKTNAALNQEIVDIVKIYNIRHVKNLDWKWK